jgi:hypothetical protein
LFIIISMFLTSSNESQKTQFKNLFGVVFGLFTTFVVVVQLTSLIGSTVASAVTIPAGSYSDLQITQYNSVTCGSPITGATALTGAAAYNNTGTLGAALSSGNFVGVKDGAMVFKDATGNMEQYGLLNGLGFYEDAPGGPMKPISLLTPNPHMGEDLISAAGVKNPAIIDTYSSLVALIDADGSLSEYSVLTGTMTSNPTWTSFTGGGSLSGVTLANVKSTNKIIAMETGWVFAVNAAGTGLDYYLASTGTYVGPWGTGASFTGGPLAGKTLSQALANPVAGISFIGIHTAYYDFYDSNTGVVHFYDYTSNTYYPATSPSILTGTGTMAGSLKTAMESGRFLGVDAATLNFINVDGQLEYYNVLTGIGIAQTTNTQPLEGPQAGNQVLTDAFVDTVDGGYVFIDKDGTTSVYYSTGVLFNDQTWKKFTGGSLAGQSPSKTNILATEDGIYYTIGADGSLEGYSYANGVLFPDVLTCTTLTGGYLDGKSLADAVANKIPNVLFLGIAAGTLVFATPTTTTSSSSSSATVSSSSVSVSTSSDTTVSSSTATVSSSSSEAVSSSSSALSNSSSAISTSTTPSNPVTPAGGGNFFGGSLNVITLNKPSSSTSSVQKEETKLNESKEVASIKETNTKESNVTITSNPVALVITNTVSTATEAPTMGAKGNLTRTGGKN